MDATLRLTGRVAIVTGGSRGIGLAVAGALLGRGAEVTIGARREEDLQVARERLLSANGAVDTRALHTMRVDVRDAAQVERLVEDTVERFGALDILINNAGVGGFSEVAEQPLEQWRQIIETNLSGVFYCCRAAIPHLRRRGGGWIINISSLAGKNAFAGGAAYCASKSGLNAFSEALMQEVRYENIRVSYIMPGTVDTGFRALGSSSGNDWKLTADDVSQVVLDLLAHPARSLPSRVELRPAKPRK